MTFLHEMGHSLDYGLVKASSDKWHNYSRKLENVVERHRIKRIDKFPEVVANKFKEIKEKYKLPNGIPNFKAQRKDGWCALSDIFDALTNGNMFDKASYAISGHGAKYFRQYGTKEAEIFAQYFYLRTNNCTEALNVLKENVPDLLKSLETLFTLYVKELKEL